MSSGGTQTHRSGPGGGVGAALGAAGWGVATEGEVVSEEDLRPQIEGEGVPAAHRRCAACCAKIASIFVIYLFNFITYLVLLLFLYIHIFVLLKIYY